MQEDAVLIRETSMDGAVDYLIPTDRVEPRALERYQRHRENLRLKIKEFAVGKIDGTLWLCRSVIYNPEALIGSEGIAFKPANGQHELLWIVGY